MIFTVRDRETKYCWPLPNDLIKSNQGGTILFKLQADEFAILDSKALELDSFTDRCKDIVKQISNDIFTIDDSEINLTVSSGISHGTERLLANATVALKVAKKQKKDFIVFDDSMLISEEYEENIKVASKLKEAIEEDRIVPFYQPIVNTDTQKTEKYEALMRLIERDGTVVSPFSFLEISKVTKLYTKLTQIIIEKSFKEFADKNFELSINIGVDDILNKEVVEFIKEAVARYKIGEKVIFEIVESEGIESFDEVMNFIKEVKTLGCKIAIDDFGTGYSNFEYLMKLQVDFIKIDASMIKNIDRDENSRIIAKTINDFAKKLNMKTVGEFVYSEKVYNEVKSMGIDYCQGYYFSEPKRDID